MLTNYNAISCPKCLSKLQVKNRGTYSLIGGVGGGFGGGVGGLLLNSWLYTGEVLYIALFIVLLSAIFFVALGLSAKFLRLEARD
ncbi:MAG: hypothetical protein QXZ02_05415 [Candidatus Bathyarchaeia archaeon]